MNIFTGFVVLVVLVGLALVFADYVMKRMDE